MVIFTHYLAQVYSKLAQGHFLKIFTSFRKCHFKDHVRLDKSFLDVTVFALAISFFFFFFFFLSCEKGLTDIQSQTPKGVRVAILTSVFRAGHSGLRIFFVLFFFKNGVNTHHVIKLGCDEHVLKMSPSTVCPRIKLSKFWRHIAEKVRRIWQYPFAEQNVVVF